MEEYIVGSLKKQPKVIDHLKSVVIYEERQIKYEYLKRVEAKENFTWFNSRTINHAMEILRNQFPVAGGLQGICSSGDHFLIKNHMFLQILRKSTRYILISAWNLENGHVNVFDPSRVSRIVSNNTEQRIANLMAYHNTSSKLYLHIIHLGETVKEKYSGLVCIAIVVYILHGCCPGMLDLSDLGSIVDHMTNCLATKQFSPLLFEKSSNKRPTTSFSRMPCLPPIGGTDSVEYRELVQSVSKVTQEIRLYCLCHRPQDKYMTPCHKCSCLFHKICIRRFGCTDRGEFLCPDCVSMSEFEIVQSLPHLRLAFDAYVSYKCNDLWFIKRQLIPHVERGARYNYRLIINERDFTPGHIHVDEIIEKLALSSKCFVIVSKHFLHGQLKLFEWDQIARHRWFSMKVILIDPYEEVMASCGNMSKSFRHYMEERKHLEWKQDMSEMEEIRFWRSIRQFLGAPLIKCYSRLQPEPWLFNCTPQEKVNSLNTS